jgi:hypothetical protein
MLNKPIALITDTAGGQAIGTTYPPTTDVTFATTNFDTDSMHPAPGVGLVVRTPGFYKVWYTASSTSAGNALMAGVWFTTGFNNPNGVNQSLGPFWGSYSKAGSSVGTRCSAAGMVPLFMYNGDWVHLRLYADGGTMVTDSVVPTRLGLEWMGA